MKLSKKSVAKVGIYVLGVFLVLSLIFLVNFIFASTLNSDTINANEWTMYGKYLNHTSWDGIDYYIIPDLISANFTTGADVKSSPAVANGYVYIGSRDGQFYQLNASNISQLIANFSIGDTDSPPSIANGYVYVGSNTQGLFQLNASNVSQLISNFSGVNDTFIGEIGVGNSPIIANGYVYIASGEVSNNIYQLNASNISQFINGYSSQAVSSTIAIANGYAYFASTGSGSGGTIYQLNASNISQSINNYTTGSTIRSSVAIYNDYLYVALDSKKVLIQLNASNVSQFIANYTAIIPSNFINSPAIFDDSVYISDSSFFYQLNASNVSQLLNNYSTDGATSSSPSVSKGYVFTGSNTGNVYQLNASNISQLVNIFTTSGTGIASSIAIAHGYIYFGSDDNKVYQIYAFNDTYSADIPTPLSISTSLIYPTNFFNSSNQTQKFSANFTATNGNLTNTTLIIYNHTNILSYSNFSTLNNGTLDSKNLSILNLADGVYNWTYYTCADNNTGAKCEWSSNRTITIDSTSPNLNIDYPPNSTNFIVTTIAINYTRSDSGLGLGSCWYSNNSGVANRSLTNCANISGVWNQGWNIVYIYANDTLNNLNQSQVSFFVDSIKPKISIVYPTNASNFTTTSLGINYTISDTNLESCWWTNNSGVTNISITCGDNVSYTSNQNWNVIKIYANDTLNNLNQSQVSFFVDSIYPQIDYGVGIENDFANVTHNWIYINTTWNETNFRNITFRISNSNKQTFTTATYVYNFTSIADGVYYYNATICDVLNQCNTTSTRKINLDTTSPNLIITSPQPITYAVDIISLNFSVSDNSGLDSCWYGNDTDDNVTIDCSLNTTISNIDGAHTLHLWANDTLNNIVNVNVAYIINTGAPAITLNNPTDNKYLISGNNIQFNFTADDVHPIDTCELWGNWSGIWKKNQSLSSITNLVQTNFNLLNITDGVYKWGVWCNESFNTQSFSLNNTVTIDRFVPSNNIYTNRTPELFNYVTLKSNLTLSNFSGFSYCNFSLINPYGKHLLLNNKNTTLTGIVVESDKVYLNQSGTYFGNVTCITNAYVLFQSVNFTISNYTLYSQPPFGSTYSFSAVTNKTELRTFNLSLYDNTLGDVQFAISINITDMNNFTTSLSEYSILFNSTENSTNQRQIKVSINASNQIANGTYFGNITLTNSTYGLEYTLNFTYGISPPAGIPSLFFVGSTELCSYNTSSLCYKSLTLDFGDIYGVTYSAKNTGGFILSSCNLKVAKTFVSQDFSAWTSNTPINFSLAINEIKDVTITFSPTDTLTFDRYYAGLIYLECLNSDIMGHLATTDITNRPYLDIAIHVPSGWVGGAGGTTPKKPENITIRKYCGDGICQNPASGFPKGNDLNITEDFYSCSQDCPPANVDTLFKGCFDRDDNTPCIFSQAVYQYVGLLIAIILGILAFGTTKDNVPLYRYGYIKLKSKIKRR